MFASGIHVLISSAVDTGNLPAPRPSDVLADRLSQSAMRTLQAPAEYMPLSERVQDPETAGQAKVQELYDSAGGVKPIDRPWWKFW